jgi:hypothetical protein
MVYNIALTNIPKKILAINGKPHFGSNILFPCTFCPSNNGFVTTK